MAFPVTCKVSGQGVVFETSVKNFTFLQRIDNVIDFSDKFNVSLGNLFKVLLEALCNP